MSFQQLTGVGVGMAANARFQSDDIKRTTGGMASTNDNGVGSRKYLLPAADQLGSSHLNSPMYNLGAMHGGVRNEGSTA